MLKRRLMAVIDATSRDAESEDEEMKGCSAALPPSQETEDREGRRGERGGSLLTLNLRGCFLRKPESERIRLATIPGIGIARNRFFCQFLGMWVRNRFLFKGVTCSDSFFHTLKDIYIQSIIAILINFDAQLGKILINFPWVPTWKRNHDRSHDSDSLGAKESESDLESHFEESLQA